MVSIHTTDAIDIIISNAMEHSLMAILNFKIAHGAFEYNRLVEKLMLNGVQRGLPFTTAAIRETLPVGHVRILDSYLHKLQ